MTDVNADFFFPLEKNNNKTTSLFVWLQVSGLTLFQRFICRNSCLNECSCVSGRWWGEAIGILFSACSCQINTSLENNMGLWCASQSALGLLKKKKKNTDISIWKDFFFCTGAVVNCGAQPLTQTRSSLWKSIFPSVWQLCEITTEPFKRRMERRSRALKSLKSCKTHLSVWLAANRTERKGRGKKKEAQSYMQLDKGPDG